MKPTDAPPSAPPTASSLPARNMGPETIETDEQAFYASQEAAFAELRAYHASRPRRKR